MTIDLNGTIISFFAIMLGGIIWKDMMVSGSDFWYSHTLNPAIVVILDRKPFWNHQSINWDVVVSGHCINSYLPSHTWHLNLGSNAIFISLKSV